MYRLLVLALVLTVTVAFSGCGAKQDTATPAEGETAAPAAPEKAETPSAAATEEPAEAAAEGGEEAAADSDEESWDEFEVVPSASASAQKKE